MKILYFATPDIALETLESLNQSEDIEILAVITQPDKKSGRKKLLTAPPVKVLAKELNIEVKQPNTQEELRKVLKNYKVKDERRISDSEDT